MDNILVVEDDREIAFAIKEYMESKNYKVSWASTGKEGLEEFKLGDYQILLVDVMMPEMDGFTLCRNIRLISDVPIIIISAKNKEVDKISGLNLGADDYLTKPFSLLELEARIESHLRRYRRYKNIDNKDELTRYTRGLMINEDREEIYLDDKIINLTQKELELFNLLRNNMGTIFSKEDLYENIWGEINLDGNNTVTVHIKSLREKLGEDAKNPNFIETVWGRGYKFIGERLN